MIKSFALAATLFAVPFTPSLLEKPTTIPGREFPIHTIETAPEASKAALKGYEEKFGFVPNLAGVMSGSPALLTSYLGLQENLEKMGTLSSAEVNVIQLTIAVENECSYCTAGHTMAGKMFFQTPDEVMDGIKKREALKDPKLKALSEFTLAVYEKRGQVTDAELMSFLDAGYSRAQALEVVAGISAKVMTNFTNHIVGTPLDEAMKPFAQ